jgi:cytoskeletal protein CcmA (bactofilin family)
MFGFGGKVDTVIGQGAEFRGNVNVEGAIVVDGRVDGNVTASERITLGVHAAVCGNLQAPEIIVGGKVDGNVHATVRAELLLSAVVDGDLRTPSLSMHPGALLSGKVSMDAAADSVDSKLIRKQS